VDIDRADTGGVRLLVSAVHARALTRADRAAESVTALQAVLQRADQPAAARAVALLALADAQRAVGEVAAAESSEREFDELVRDLLGPDVAPQAARTAVSDLARGVVSRGGAQTEPAHAVPTEDVEAELQRETAAWLEAERAEAHRLEVERSEQARIEAERREVERLAAEQAAAEQLAAERAEAERAEHLEAERRAAAEEEERLAVKRRREERLEAHRLELERLEAERLEAERLEAEHREAERQAEERTQLAAALDVWEDAKARRDRRGARAANERVVELLRPAAQADPAQFGTQLRQALEELSSARLRTGDILGSRALAREARVLAQTLGR
jgi:chemosensory pili system protein ChpA (sensor histidine kinase/response regulator)